MSKLIWVGHRESEVYCAEDYFERTITSWGSGIGQNISYCQKVRNRKVIPEERNKFFADELQPYINNDYKIMFYNTTLAYSVMRSLPELANNLICANNKELLTLLNNKIYSRLWLSNYLPVLSFSLYSGHDCTLKYLSQHFEGINSFIIQEYSSAGGLGTYILNQENEDSILNRLISDTLYLVSQYINPSISINTHILIGENVVVFPPSVQLNEEVHSNLVYCGGDYVNYKNIEGEYKKQIHKNSIMIGKLLQGIGYRGVCGIDYLLHDGIVYFVELNPRFQASTLLLNLSLKEQGLPSMQQLQMMAFTDEEFPIEVLESLDVNYSLYKYTKDERDHDLQYNEKLHLIQNSPEKYDILYDGFNEEEAANESYLYSVIWKGHISSCSTDYKLQIHPNIPLGFFIDLSLPNSYTEDQLIRLKIALLNQGLRISDSVRKELCLMGGYNESTFSSIDLILMKNLRFNSPINTRFSSMSPFSLLYRHNTFYLAYYQQVITSVKLELSKSIAPLRTTNNVPYKQIAFISGDRLRIKPEQRCYFKMTGKGCYFCPGIMQKPNVLEGYSIDDVKEVIDYCLENENFRHIMIGGGSPNPKSDGNKILSVITYIRSKTDKPIYLMCLPPNNISQIDKYVRAGVNEIAFNIELLDRKLALSYMPGKGCISLQDYINKLSYAVSLLGDTGNVRSMIMVGIESMSNTLELIELLCVNKIQPVLSLFRPVCNCRIPHLIQPSNDDVYKLYKEAEIICASHGLTLGPSCSSCQNNTLALTIKQD